MRGPGIPKNLRISAPVSSIDIAPTLLALAGVETPKPMDGLDLAPLWRGGDQLPFEDRHLYGESSGGLVYDAIASGFFPVYRSVRQGRYKLVYESKGGTHALFDLEEDPREENDISTREPDLTAHLSAALRDRYRDFTPEPSPEDRVELEDKDLEKLRALGYVP
jgi:arylsulfatase A-like enzyme